MSEARPEVDEGLRVPGARVAVVAAEFNPGVVDGLIEGALDALRRHGVSDAHIEVTRVPGAWELPLVAAHIADQERCDAIIALGAVIRGGTPHFEYVCRGCTDGLMRVQQEFGIPVGFGVLTCDDEAQAQARSGSGEGNKGAETATAVLRMLALLRRLDV